jgi:hypothetical protein
MPPFSHELRHYASRHYYDSQAIFGQALISFRAGATIISIFAGTPMAYFHSRSWLAL